MESCLKGYEVSYTNICLDEFKEAFSFLEEEIKSGHNHSSFFNGLLIQNLSKKILSCRNGKFTHYIDDVKNEEFCINVIFQFSNTEELDIKLFFTISKYVLFQQALEINTYIDSKPLT